jgi:hypothetical protein
MVAITSQVQFGGQPGGELSWQKAAGLTLVLAPRGLGDHFFG